MYISCIFHVVYASFSALATRILADAKADSSGIQALGTVTNYRERGGGLQNALCGVYQHFPHILTDSNLLDATLSNFYKWKGQRSNVTKKGQTLKNTVFSLYICKYCMSILDFLQISSYTRGENNQGPVGQRPLYRGSGP